MLHILLTADTAVNPAMSGISTIVMLVAMLATLLVACEDKFTCDNCNKEKSGKKNTTTFAGKKITYCDDCKPEVEAIIDMGNAMGLGDMSADEIEDLAEELQGAFG